MIAQKCLNNNNYSLSILFVFYIFCGSVSMKVDLKVIDSLFLATQKKHDFIVYELELSGHLLVDIIDFVHGSDGSMDCLEVGQVFMESVLHATLFLATQGCSSVAADILLEKIFLAAVSDQQGSCFFQCLLGLESVENDESSLLALVHVESVSEDDHHERDDEGSPDHQDHINYSSEDGSRVVVSIADCGHGDYGEPECVLEGVYVVAEGV